MNSLYLLHSHGHVSHSVPAINLQLILGFIFIFLLAAYITAVIITNRRYKKWPIFRTICWTIGMIIALAAVVGPLANSAHSNFTAHMVSHLLLSMVAPIFMAIAKPMTLLLRTANTSVARKLTTILKSGLLQFVSHPVTAAVLNVGGLWMLYTTDLYTFMHENALFALFIHLHFFIAGYVFTISIIYFDPVYHQYSYRFRAAVLIIAIAGHDILSKYMYANPPAGVSQQEAEMGSMVMYYAGDWIEVALIIIFCWQWYKSAKPRKYVTVEFNRDEQVAVNGK
ncbi:cytochrome c oxidase assembly protein [Solibacillus isronensis]|uniref:cytochrome c oxidase assembly protein n=1 Tax=Solibacillus isronensis TaxID=412383 RepID=UPI0009A8D9CF|nr:cytochrome c oxidase assembly protein [Solibacillus isronensis]